MSDASRAVDVIRAYLADNEIEHEETVREASRAPASR